MNKLTKKVVALLLVILLVTGGATAFADNSPDGTMSVCWSDFCTVFKTLNLNTDGDIVYGATAYTYEGGSVASVHIVIYLQRYVGSGLYTTVATLSDSRDGYWASAGSTYTSVMSGTTYRLKVQAYCYDSSDTLIESTGWLYAYLST